MEKIKDFSQLSLKDFVYVSWEYKTLKGNGAVANEFEWVLGKVSKINKDNKQYPADIRVLSTSSGSLVEVGKIVSLTDTILKHMNYDNKTALKFRYKEFSKLTESEAAVHLI
jgi:hypothetical protein